MHLSFRHSLRFSSSVLAVTHGSATSAIRVHEASFSQSMALSVAAVPAPSQTWTTSAAE
jgi:hypothetical protein